MPNKNSSFLQGRFGHETSMTAKQIMDIVYYGDHYTEGLRPEEALEQKYQEAAFPYMGERYEGWQQGELIGHYGGLRDEIVRNGYNSDEPVHLGTHNEEGGRFPHILEGHHRIAVMYKHFPDTPIPVRVWKDKKEFLKSWEDDPFGGA